MEKSALKYASFFGVENDISVACCGSNLSKYQVQLLEEAGAKEIIIAFDRQFQDIGDDEFKKLKRNLMNLNNKYCNLILECSNNGMNEILINSLELEQFLRKKYPNFKYILSTTRCERDIFKINEATKNYDLVVIDYRDNRNLNFLNAIEDKSKIEIAVAFIHSPTRWDLVQ